MILHKDLLNMNDVLTTQVFEEKIFVTLQNLMDVAKINKFKTLTWNPLVTFTLCTYMFKRL
jgi:hypothetical protein